jgi:hypothetical protein
LGEKRAGPLKLLSGVVYRPPACGPISPLLDCLSHFCPGYDYTILMGNYNINLEADSPEKRELLDILDIFSLLMTPTASIRFTILTVSLALLTWFYLLFQIAYAKPRSLVVLESHTTILLLLLLRLVIYVSR